ncbi:hypothetical protein Tco_0060154 [Tanacetum coccineum]
MGDENPIRTPGDYSKPSHEGYRNTIELPAGNNVVPLRSDTIRLGAKTCSSMNRIPEIQNQHLKDFLKLVDSLDLDGKNRERTRLAFILNFPNAIKLALGLKSFPTDPFSTMGGLTTRFLGIILLPGRTTKFHNDILVFQQHHGESHPKHRLGQDFTSKNSSSWHRPVVPSQNFLMTMSIPVTRRTIDQSLDNLVTSTLRILAILGGLALYDKRK